MSTTERKQKGVRSYPRLSLIQQCTLLKNHRNGLYYWLRSESLLNLRLIKAMDLYFLDDLYYAAERNIDYLNLDLGYRVNDKTFI
ncbi:hypothetical protein [Maribacter antarcticus]|uniref:hypothetical protein n=1 Tax=Maribacter antarcticus TaxID=505250 RepID=UPI0012EBEE44|nr:hypothetical protein [Maribacter antarcticus]